MLSMPGKLYRPKNTSAFNFCSPGTKHNRMGHKMNGIKGKVGTVVV